MMEEYDSDAVIDAIEAMHSCRCCLRRPPDKGLKTLYTHDGKTEIYLDMIQECFNIRVVMRNDDESGICEACVGRLRDASDFKHLVQRSQTELQRLQFIHFFDEKPAIKSEGVEGNTTNDDFTLREVHPVKLEAKMLEGETINNEELVQALPLAVPPPAPARTRNASNHVLEPLEKLVGSESAGTLTESSASAIARKQMAKLAHLPPAPPLDAEPGQPAPRNRGSPKPVSCDICKRQFQFKHLLVKHMPRHTGIKPYACEVCNKRYSLKSVLKNHLKTHIDNKFSCDVCQKEFNYGYNLKSHMRVHTGVKPFSCEVCNREFSKKMSLKSHLTSSGHLLPISCIICKKRFAHESELHEHITCLHGIKETNPLQTKKRDKKQYTNNFQNHLQTNKLHTEEQTRNKVNLSGQLFCCEICGKQYRLKKLFDAHMNRHTGVKLEFCTLCDKRFAEKSTLKSHMLLHTGEKPYPCVICQKRFRQSSALQYHMLIHKGVKPYSCEVCNKDFRHKSALKVHSQRHTGQKKHGCDICKKEFIVLAALKEHQRIHTGEQPYVCKVCQKQFRLASHVRRHLKRVHNEAVSNYMVIKK
ncbi:oocyte zinc finger protein XlCOF6-like isoform X1 [Cydia pomonella]|uniref:oocyte zinc finger protein XlCOF6-like isoform X1 n=1 Tax=Cydia pomonella TaxID=82600 RepID=UPI002ADE29C8|nr:oocyte zinc finger protein XlCOF6-like isoform X1 [Cydia pomonella]